MPDRNVGQRTKNKFDPTHDIISTDNNFRLFTL